MLGLTTTATTNRTNLQNKSKYKPTLFLSGYLPSFMSKHFHILPGVEDFAVVTARLCDESLFTPFGVHKCSKSIVICTINRMDDLRSRSIAWSHKSRKSSHYQPPGVPRSRT